MGMSSMIFDNVDKFYDIACEEIKSCEDYNEFQNKMKDHVNLLAGSSDADNYEDGLYDVWQEYWSKYAI
jgi:hypothetical protein